MSFLKKLGDNLSNLSNLFGNDRKLEQLFMEAMDHFSSKEYSIAYKKFLKVYKSTRSSKIKLHCLLNASTSAESLNEKGEASALLVSAAKLKCQLNDPAKEIAETLDKAYLLLTKDNRKIDYDSQAFVDIVAPLMIFKIATQDKNFTQKLGKTLEEYKVENLLNKFALETYSNFINHPEKIWEKEDFIIFPYQFPKEFTTYVRSTQDAIRGFAALTMKLETDNDVVKTGQQVSVKVKILNHTPLLIEKLFLQPGSKGQYVSTTYDSKQLNLTNKNEELEYEFVLEPHLTGQWIIGPLHVQYLVHGSNFEAKSETIKVTVNPGSKELNLDLTSTIIEEDFEFELLSKIENSGETPLENIKIQLKIPSQGKLTEGASERSIFELRNGEKIEFSNKVKFEAGILGKSFKIKLLASFDGTDHEKELILGTTGN